MNEQSNHPDERLDPQLDDHLNDHIDEMTGMLYVEGQLERARAQRVSTHTQECPSCRTLLRALERESRLLTRAMLEEDEPLPSRLAAFQQSARKSMQWIWGAVFGLAARGPAAGDRVCLRSVNRFDRCRSFSSAAVRKRSRARTFAASSGGDLYSSHLIQRA